MNDKKTQEAMEVTQNELSNLIEDVGLLDLSAMEIAEIEIDAGVKMTTHRT